MATRKKKVKAKPIKKAKTIVKVIKPETGMVLAHNPANISQEFFVASELADDNLIEQEILGQAMEHYVYGFDQDGKRVTGLSVAGVNEVARLLNRNPKSGCKIRIIPDSLKVERDVNYDGHKGVEVQVVSENMVTGETGIGIKFEPYKKRGKKGEYENTFAIEKAVSKAERNAKRKLMPEKAAVEMIRKFVANNKYAKIIAPDQARNQISNQSYQQKTTNVDYLGQLKTVLYKNGGKTEISALKMYNDFTGESAKTLKVNQDEAKKMLWNLLNSPMGSELKK
jgi:hypothetical protein